MRKVLTKLGTYYYYDKKGKRISAKEYARRSKISASLKARHASKKKSKSKPKARWRKNIHKGKDGIEIVGWHREYYVNSGWVESIDELLPLMLDTTVEIIEDIKARDITTRFVSFGYDFSVRYEKNGKTHEFSNRGFSPRINIRKSVKQFRELIDISFDDIASRFEGYLNREATSAVRLNFIIVEKLISERKAKKKTSKKKK